MQGIGKRFVYILRSDSDPDRHYVGITSDPDRRLEWHNQGPCGQTVRNRPWSFVVILEFPTEGQAVRFEKYLKTGAGRAFATRHFGGLETAPTNRATRVPSEVFTFADGVSPRTADSASGADDVIVVPRTILSQPKGRR